MKPLDDVRTKMTQAASEMSDAKSAEVTSEADMRPVVKKSFDSMAATVVELKRLEGLPIAPSKSERKKAQLVVNELRANVLGLKNDVGAFNLLNSKRKMRLNRWIELYSHWFGEESGKFEPKGKPASSVLSAAEPEPQSRDRAIEDLMNKVRRLEEKEEARAMAKKFDYMTDAYTFLRGPNAPVGEFPHPVDLANPGISLSPPMTLGYMRREKVDAESLVTGLTKKLILSEAGRGVEAAIVESMSPKEARPITEATKAKVKGYTTDLLEMYRHWLREREMMPMLELTTIYAEAYERLKTTAHELTVDLISRLTNKEAALALSRTLVLDPSRLPPELRDVAKEWQSKVAKGGFTTTGKRVAEREDGDEDQSESAAATKSRSSKKRYREKQKQKASELQQLLKAVAAHGLKWKDGKLS